MTKDLEKFNAKYAGQYLGDAWVVRASDYETLEAEARQIIADLVEYAECNDPGNPHLARAKGFLSEGSEKV